MNTKRILLLCLLSLGCGREKSDRPDDSSADTGAPPIEIPADNVANALGDCLGRYRTPEAYPNQLGQGDELQRYTLHDPEAVCNDGTRAVMYVRPATSDTLADVWSIHLQGGGGCSSYASCAIRWCGLDYYDSSKMSSRNLPLTIAGFGIYDAEEQNLLQEANHVFFYYCSSDAWRGLGSASYDPDDLEIPEELPVEVPDELPSYTLFRRGHTILASGLDELAAGIVADDGLEMPPLDDARLVVFNGTSGGSAGARVNADYVRERLAPSGTSVLAVFDAANFPGPAHLPDYATELEAMLALGWEQSRGTDSPTPFMDETCWDRLGGTADEGRCYDLDYVMLNHITTPFFVRQDLRDIGGIAESVGVAEDDFEAGVIAMLGSLEDLRFTAVEGEDITVIPGAYGPNCAQHVALESTQWWALATLDDESGGSMSFQDAVIAWYGGAQVSLIDDPNTGDEDGPRSSCEDVDPAH